MALHRSRELQYSLPFSSVLRIASNVGRISGMLSFSAILLSIPFCTSLEQIFHSANPNLSSCYTYNHGYCHLSCKDNHFVALFIPLRQPFSAVQDCTSALPMWDGQETKEADECKCCYTHPPLDGMKQKCWDWLSPWCLSSHPLEQSL